MGRSHTQRSIVSFLKHVLPSVSKTAAGNMPRPPKDARKDRQRRIANSPVAQLAPVPARSAPAQVPVNLSGDYPAQTPLPANAAPVSTTTPPTNISRRADVNPYLASVMQNLRIIKEKALSALPNKFQSPSLQYKQNSGQTPVIGQGVSYPTSGKPIDSTELGEVLTRVKNPTYIPNGNDLQVLAASSDLLKNPFALKQQTGIEMGFSSDYPEWQNRLDRTQGPGGATTPKVVLDARDHIRIRQISDRVRRAKPSEGPEGSVVLTTGLTQEGVPKELTMYKHPRHGWSFLDPRAQYQFANAPDEAMERLYNDVEVSGPEGPEQLRLWKLRAANPHKIGQTLGDPNSLREGMSAEDMARMDGWVPITPEGFKNNAYQLDDTASYVARSAGGWLNANQRNNVSTFSPTDGSTITGGTPEQRWANVASMGENAADRMQALAPDTGGNYKKSSVTIPVLGYGQKPIPVTFPQLSVSRSPGNIEQMNAFHRYGVRTNKRADGTYAPELAPGGSDIEALVSKNRLEASVATTNPNKASRAPVQTSGAPAPATPSVPSPATTSAPQRPATAPPAPVRPQAPPAASSPALNEGASFRKRMGIS